MSNWFGFSGGIDIFTDRFIGDHDATGEQHLLDIAGAESEAEIEPDGMQDNFGGKLWFL